MTKVKEKLSEEQKHTISDMYNKGISSRKIALKVLGRESRKSTVNDFIKEMNKKGGFSLPNTAPKILLFDIEYAPAEVMAYGRFKQFIVQDFVKKEGYMLSFTAKWLSHNNIVAFNLPYYDTYTGPECNNDFNLVFDLWKLLDEADFVVAHNLKGYDWKQMNTRFVYHHLNPVSPTKLIDTLEICKKHFKFPSNSLDAVAAYLGLGRKTENSGARMWKECILDGSKEAWKQELIYNINDVDLLEQIYLKIRAFDNKHPSLSPYYNDGKMHCTCCGSTNLVLTPKKAYTALSEFLVYQCSDCGKHSRGRSNQRDKESMMTTLTNAL